MARAYFSLGGTIVEMLGPRAEQLGHTLALYCGEPGKKLAERIGSHVADGEPGEDRLELDAAERGVLLDALERVVAASRDVPADVAELHRALADTRGATAKA